MESILFQIVVMTAVMLAVYSLWRIVQSFTNPEERKLKGRLIKSMEDQVSSEIAKSIRRRTGLDELSGWFSNYEVFRTINKTLLQSAPNMTFQKFMTYVGASAFTGFFIVFIITFGLFVALVAAVLGGSIPFLYLVNKRNKRQRGISDQLPDALDFLGRAMRAGHSMASGFQMMSEELPEPIAGEFRRAYEQHSLGASMEDALRAMAQRVESTDFAFFVTAVLIQRQTGGDLSEVLNNISAMIRARVRLQMHVKSKTAEGRFTGYILAGFPALMFVLSYCLNKEYAGRMLAETLGLVMLGGAFGLQLIGLFVIRKLTVVRV